MKRPQSGFTLVEIAIVLVVIGLLLGGVLKGQELIASARVRGMADQQAGIQAAYFGFQDRYRAVPGDMFEDDAEQAIGQTVNLGNANAGDSDGQLSAPGSWRELNGVWEHLSKAGFIKGSYPGTGTPDPASNPPTSNDAPINVFNGVLILARHDGYEDTATAADRLVLHMGRHVPVDIARELDVKMDDGRPLTGVLRNSVAGANEWESVDGGVACVDATNNEWLVANDGQNCNPVSLF